MAKEKLITIAEILAVGSITAIGLAIGGTIGASVMAGIGINLCSNIVQSGNTKLKEQWLTSSNGILNHDIQHALTRAYIKAIENLKNQYFGLSEFDALTKKEKTDIKTLFKQLVEQAYITFLPSLEKAITEKDIKTFLYSTPESASDIIYKRINKSKLFSTYNEKFKVYFENNLLKEVQFWFGEELKTDNKESNKAWRAFQRLLLEGIQADVKAVKTNQELITNDLKILSKIESQINELKDSIDKRIQDEPFGKFINSSLDEVKNVLSIVGKTTQRSEGKIDSILSGVNTLIQNENKKQEYEIPKEFKVLAEQVWKFRNNACYEKAIEQVENGISQSKQLEDEHSEAYFNSILATLLHEKYHRTDEAVSIILNSIVIFKKYNDKKRISQSYLSLSNYEVARRNFLQAKSYAEKAFELTLENKDESKHHYVEIANCYIELGWVEHQLGNYSAAISEYNKGLELLISEEIKDDVIEEERRKHLIAIVHHNLGLSYERTGNIINTKEFYKKSINEFRELELKYDLAKVLFLLSHIHFREAEYEEGEKYLSEASKIYLEVKEYGELVRCLDLKGKVNYTRGNEDTAYNIFLECCQLLEKHGGNLPLLEELYHKVGEIYFRRNKFKRAIEYYEKSKKLSEQNKHYFGVADSIHGIAKIEKKKGNEKGYKNLLKDAIYHLNSSLSQVESDEEKAFLLGTIGHYNELLEEYQEALQYFVKAKNLYTQKNSVSGIARCMGEIARIYHLLGKRNEAFDTFRSIKKIADGTPYYDLIAGSAINLGNYQKDLGNYEEAKILFQEAEYFTNKYNLHYNPELKILKEEIDELIKIRKPVEISFEDLLKDLFDLIKWYPEKRDSIFRMWFYCRKHEIFANLKSLHGIKFMICEDDVSKFLKYSKSFYAYMDISLQVVSDDFPPTSMDIVPYPPDKIIYEKMAFPAGKEIDGVKCFHYLQGSIESRYTLCAGSMMTSEITNNEGLVVMGWAPGLPPQAYELILESNTTELLKNKTFFFPHERHKANDRLLSDLYIAKDYNFFPFYFRELPTSKNVNSAEFIDLKLPLLTLDSEKVCPKNLLKLKNNLKKLITASKDTWNNLITDFLIEVEELNQITKAESYLNVRLHLLEFNNGFEKEYYPVLIWK